MVSTPQDGAGRISRAHWLCPIHAFWSRCDARTTQSPSGRQAGFDFEGDAYDITDFYRITDFHSITDDAESVIQRYACGMVPGVLHVLVEARSVQAADGTPAPPFTFEGGGLRAAVDAPPLAEDQPPC